MTILVTGDWHLSDNPRDAYRHDFQLWLRRAIRTHRIDNLVILGDLTEEKDRHRAQLVHAVVEHLAELAKLCRVHILCGNHDFADREFPFYKFIEHLDGVYWIDKPERRAVGESRTGGGRWSNCTMLPYTSDYGRDWSGFLTKHGKFFDPNDTNPLVFAHNTFDGANAGHGQVLSGIPLSVFEGSIVVSGDVHVPQTIGPVTYVGAPYAVDFGDDYAGRVLKIQGKKTIKSIPYTGPTKRLIRVKSVADLDGIEVANRDVVKIEVSLEKTQVAMWPELSARVRKWAEGQGFTLHAVVSRLANQEAAPVAKSELKQLTDLELVKNFAARRDVDSGTLKVGWELMK